MPTFHENWLSAGSRQTLHELASLIADVPGRIIEIGSWEGRSTIILANAIGDRTVHAVDTWQGSPSDISVKLAAERDVHATFAVNIAEATAGNVAEHRMDWRDYRRTDHSLVAFVFIDAEHTYDEVIDTIDAFLPLASPGAVFCGDDREIPGVWQAVTERFPDADVAHAIWWSCIEEEPACRSSK